MDHIEVRYTMMAGYQQRYSNYFVHVHIFIFTNRRQESRFISISGGLIFPQNLVVDFVRDTFLFKFDVDVNCFDLVLCVTRDGENLFCEHQITDKSNSSRSDIKTFASGLNYTSICGILSFDITLQKRGVK